MASRPARSITSVLGIALGIATVLSVQVVDHNTILTQAARRAPAKARFDVELQPVQAGIPAEGATPRALAEDPGIRSFCAAFVNNGVLHQDGAEDGVEVRIAGLGPFAAQDFQAYRVAEGRDLTQPDGHEVLLPQRLAAELGLNVGDSVDLQRVLRVRQRCVDGELVQVAEDGGEPAVARFEVVGLVDASGLGGDRIALVPFEAGLPLYRDSHLQPLYWAVLTDGAVFQDVRERLKTDYLVEQRKASLIGERIDQRAFRKSLRFTSMLSLLLGLFVIYNSFSMALVERVREIGLLRAMGLRRREIGAAVLAEGTLLALAGAVAGLLLTVGLVWLLSALHITTLGFGKPLRIQEVPWSVVAGVLAAGVGVAVLGVGAPLLKARKLSVIDAIRAGRLALRSDPGFTLRVMVFVGIPVAFPLLYVIATPPLGERQELVTDIVLKMSLILGAFFLVMLVFPGVVHRLVEWVVAPLRRLWPVEVPLVRAAVRGSRHRIMGTLTGLSVVVASIFCVRAVNQSFLDEMRSFSDRAMSGRVYVTLREPATLADVQAAAAKVPGLARTYSLSAEVHTPFPLRGVRMEDALAEIPLLARDPALRRDFANGEALILSRFLADSFGYERGQVVRLPSYKGPVRLHVGAIHDGFGYFPDDRNFGLLEAGRMEQLFCVSDATGTHFIAELEDGTSGIQAAAGLRRELRELNPLRVQSAAALKNYYLTDRRQDFYVFDFILWMVALLACVGLLNSLAIALLERRREIGLLRTIGLTRGQVGRMIWLESLALGTLGGVMAVALTLPISHYALEAVRVISRLDLAFQVTPFAVVAPLVTALGIALAGAVWPSVKSGRVDLGALSRYE